MAGFQRQSPGPEVLATSVSHSRLRVAAAAARRTIGTLGVDLEYADPSRDWSGIIEMLSDGFDGVSDRLHGALIWTAYEAVFKANGCFPLPADIREIALQCNSVVADHGSVAAHFCGPVLLISMLLPTDRDFALTIAVHCSREAERSESITLQFRSVAQEGEDTGPVTSVCVPIRK